MNPKADGRPRSIGAISTTEKMHFHLRTIVAHFGANISGQTVEIDGKKIYDGGKMAILNEPNLAVRALSYGLQNWP